MILQDGQEMCIDGKWYRGGDYVHLAVDPYALPIVDVEDVKQASTEPAETVTDEIQTDKRRKK